MKLLYHADCLELLDSRVLEPVKAIWLDPPDNLGLGYDGYCDKLAPQDYYGWLERLLLRCFLKAQVIWLSFHHSHDLEIKYMVRNILKHRHPSWDAKQFLWIFTFSQYDDHDCAVSHRPILRLTRVEATLYPDAIRVTSERMLLGDSRAAGPRVPDTLWSFPRVVGNSRERRSWHPTQHPEALVQRMMLFSCNSFETWLDCFCGTGTSFRVVSAGGPVIGCEQSAYYCEQIVKDNPKLEVRVL